MFVRAFSSARRFAGYGYGCRLCRCATPICCSDRCGVTPVCAARCVARHDLPRLSAVAVAWHGGQPACGTRVLRVLTSAKEYAPADACAVSSDAAASFRRDQRKGTLIIPNQRSDSHGGSVPTHNGRVALCRRRGDGAHTAQALGSRMLCSAHARISSSKRRRCSARAARPRHLRSAWCPTGTSSSTPARPASRPCA